MTIVGAAAVFVKIPAKPVLNITTTTKRPIVPEEKKNETDLPYRIGVGISDMTGPITEIAFMGFTNMNQTGLGIHTRQWSRAFVIETTNNKSNILFISAEINIVGIALRREVVRNLQKIFGPKKYTLRNVYIGATGTYSAPGGFLGDFMLDMNIMGFSNEVFYAYLDGITESVINAHQAMTQCRLYYGQTKVWNIHINRAPYAYKANPLEERSRFDSDTDNILSQIRMVNRNGTVIGLMNWFAIHANSLNYSNRYVSSDNLGYAALKIEKKLNPTDLPGEGKGVAAFFVANAGDISPNTKGAKCSSSGTDCDNWTLKCFSYEYCMPMGPSGDDMYESAKIIGNALYEGAMKIMNTPNDISYEIEDYITIVHDYVLFEDTNGPLFDVDDRTFKFVSKKYFISASRK